MSETIKLFHIHSRTNNLRGYKDVPIDWFVEKRERPLFGPNGSLGVAYQEVIEKYDARQHDYAEMALEGYFTEAEAGAFVDWVRAHRNDDTAMVEQKSLPIANNIMGFIAIPVGGGQDFLTISNSSDYDLPFKVCGYFDVRHILPIRATKQLS